MANCRKWSEIQSFFSNRPPNYARRAIASSRRSLKELKAEKELYEQRRLQAEINKAHAIALQENRDRERFGNEIHLLSWLEGDGNV